MFGRWAYNSIKPRLSFTSDRSVDELDSEKCVDEWGVASVDVVFRDQLVFIVLFIYLWTDVIAI